MRCARTARSKQEKADANAIWERDGELLNGERSILRGRTEKKIKVDDVGQRVKELKDEALHKFEG